MAHIDIDQFQAIQWAQDVQQEIDMTDEVMMNLSRAMQQIPGEEDTIMRAIKGTGETMESVWQTVKQNHSEAIANIMDLIRQLGTQIENMKAKVDEVHRKVR